jgi:hypothetical protein
MARKQILGGVALLSILALTLIKWESHESTAAFDVPQQGPTKSKVEAGNNVPGYTTTGELAALDSRVTGELAALGARLTALETTVSGHGTQIAANLVSIGTNKPPQGRHQQSQADSIAANLNNKVGITMEQADAIAANVTTSFDMKRVQRCLKTDGMNPGLLPQDPADAVDGNAWGGSPAGRFMYCALREESLTTAVTYFPGYPGTGSPFVMTMANKWKHDHGLRWNSLIAPEGNKGYYDGLVKLYAEKDLTKFIDLRHQYVTPDHTHDLCPSGSVDLWDSDFSCSMPNQLWEVFFNT